MHLSSLGLTQFRSYEHLNLSLSPGINCLTGPNGLGKTNVLDAIHYLALTRGFRSRQDRQAVQRGSTYFMIEGELQRETEATRVQCNFVAGQGKKMLIDGRPLDKLSEHIGKIPLVVVLPSDTDLINGAAAERRRFLDMLISQYDADYLFHLIRYEQLRAQRNAQLRLFDEQGNFEADTLELWNAQLIPHGVVIQRERAKFVEAFEPIFTEIFHQIVSDAETPRLRYRPKIEEATPEAWRAALAENELRDRVNLYTGPGTHRDDLSFHIDARSVRHYGSQGQQKTFLIALRMAQYRLLEARTQTPPLLLLDDLFDRLDLHRLGRIATMLREEIAGQVFITDTNEARLRELFGGIPDSEIRYFSVGAGEVAVSEP